MKMVNTVSSKRPIDKNLIMVAKTVTTTQASTNLVTATFPCTVTGLRWDLTYRQSAANSSATSVVWAVVRVKDGLSASTMSTSDGSDLYAPEQEVLTYGTSTFPPGTSGAGAITYHWSDSTKTMRKLMGGDKISLIVLSDVASSGSLFGCVQLFCKS